MWSGTFVTKAMFALAAMLVASLAAAGSLLGAASSPKTVVAAKLTYGGKTLTFKGPGHCLKRRSGGYSASVEGRGSNYLAIGTIRAKDGSYRILARASVMWRINGRDWHIDPGGVVRVSGGLMKGTFSGRVDSFPPVAGVGSQGRGSWTCSRVLLGG
jgi:hypothetical protein